MNCCNKYEFDDHSDTIPAVMGGKNKSDHINIKNITLTIDDKLYKKLLITHNPNGQNMMKALEIVKKYVIREKLIIVGGMAIDFALRLRGSKLYSDDEIPDYDVNTPHHWIDAYEIAQWLNRIGIRDLSVINAFHPTTMKVRLLSKEVADITYIPKNIYDNIPRLNYHGFDFAHPYHQYIDQHRALSYGYENIDMDRPVLKNRWTKDMKRYDLLWDKYPLKWEGKDSAAQTAAQDYVAQTAAQDIKLDVEKILPMEIAKDQCIGSFLALQYWIGWAKKHGFKTAWNIGDCKISAKEIIYTLPADAHGISIYSNNLHELYNMVQKKYKIKSEVFYERYVDKLPRRVVLDDMWELLDNNNAWMAAHLAPEQFYVTNLQPIMLYMLVNFTVLKKEERGYIFYAGYMLCRELLKYGADNLLPELLPTAEYYGRNNETDTYALVKAKFMSRNQTEKVDIPQQPRHVYDHDMRQRKISEAYFKFNPDDSELFRMSGKQTKKFW